MTATTLIALLFALVYWAILFGLAALVAVLGRFAFELWQDWRDGTR